MSPVFIAFALQLCWMNPSENVDGTALTDLAHVDIYWGTSSGDRTAGNQEYPTTVAGDNICTEIDPGSYGDFYFVMTATDGEGNESSFSNEVVKTQEAAPTPPWVVAAPTQENAEAVETTVIVGVTGVPVLISWGVGGLTEIELVEYGDSVPLLTGTTSSGNWQFTPTRAGLYEFRMREVPDGQWYRSSDLGYLFFFKLAAPVGGGID